VGITSEKNGADELRNMEGKLGYAYERTTYDTFLLWNFSEMAVILSLCSEFSDTKT
jgi:hypothetical protein